MTTTRIGRANAAFQQLQALKTNRTQRRRQGRFLVEGVRPVDQAVAHGWEVVAWIYDGGSTPSHWRTELVDGVPADRIELSADLMGDLSDKDEPSELMAVVALPADELARIDTAGGLVVAMDEPGSPGNLGSVVRSADAFGAGGVIVTGHAADPYDPQAVRASTGSLFAVPIVVAGGPAEVREWAGGEGLQVVGTDEGGAESIGELDLRGPTLLVLGNETRGLSAAWRSACDVVARIPIGGSASSLNVAAAAAIALYELTRQRA